jgi:hypothetical protein
LRRGAAPGYCESAEHDERSLAMIDLRITRADAFRTAGFFRGFTA